MKDLFRQSDALPVYREDYAMYLDVLRAFRKDLQDAQKTLLQVRSEKDYQGFTICVHGLKSASRSIGALEFGKLSEQMEQYGKAQDEKRIADALEQYRKIAEQLCEAVGDTLHREELLKKNQGSACEEAQELNRQTLEKLCTAAQEMDMLQIDSCLQDLRQFSYPKESQNFLNQLIQKADDFEYDEIVDLLKSKKNH